LKDKIGRTKSLAAKSVTLNESKTKLDRLNNMQSTISDLSQKDEVTSLMGTKDKLQHSNSLNRGSLSSMKNRPLYKTENGDPINIIE